MSRLFLCLKSILLKIKQLCKYFIYFQFMDKINLHIKYKVYTFVHR